MIYAGIDAGSRTIKVVLLDSMNREVVAKGLADQGIDQRALANRTLDSLVKANHLNRRDIRKVVATGYGRDAVDFADKTITEITCHARGVYHQDPSVHTIIDIGGQDSKLLHLEEDGRVHDFVMNDRCAAGTGRFLEVVADRLDVKLEKLGDAARNADNPSAISSMCVVFAETEIIGLLSSGEKVENIIAGVQRAMTQRIASMAGRSTKAPIMFTGGVALIHGMMQALEQALGHPVRVAKDPQFTGALGAALLACEL